MKSNKLSILFIFQKSRKNRKGESPIYCRLTYLKKRKDFSTGFFIKSLDWNSRYKRTNNDEFINHNLNMIEQRIKESHLFLQVNEISFDVEDIYLKYKGEPSKKQRTVLEMFELHNIRMKALVGKEYSKSTYSKFEESKMHTRNFIKSAYNKGDFLLTNLTLKFLSDFDFYLKDSMNHKQITINKTLQRVRKVVKLAVGEGFLDRDPFLLYKPKKISRQIIYLTSRELKQLEQFEFSQKRLQQVKDLFIFCCYTGLAYKEMANLKKENIVKGNDGNLWIEMTRKKTNGKISVPVLKRAEEILLYKYDYEFPVISNQKFNSYLKEIADIVGLHKRLTHHVARKTFATTVLLSKGVSMDVVSKLLGHSRIGITQSYYGEVINSSLINQLVKCGLIKE